MTHRSAGEAKLWPIWLLLALLTCGAVASMAGAVGDFVLCWGMGSARSLAQPIVLRDLDCRTMPRMTG